MVIVDDAGYWLVRAHPNNLGILFNVQISWIPGVNNKKSLDNQGFQLIYGRLIFLLNLKTILLRVIPTMAFNSSHLTFCLANLLAFYLAFYLRFYLAYLSYLLTFYLAFHLAFHLACLLAFYLAYLLAFCLSYLLTFYLAYLLTFFLAFHLACLLTFYLAYLLACLLTFYLAYLSGILSVISYNLLSGIPSDILSGILSGILFGILYGFVSGRWGPVEVRRGPRRAESRRLRSGEAHSAPNLAGWGPPVRPTVLRLSPVEVWRGPLRSSAGRCVVLRGPLRSGDGKEARKGRKEGGRHLLKSNNPHLAGGEIFCC